MFKLKQVVTCAFGVLAMMLSSSLLATDNYHYGKKYYKDSRSHYNYNGYYSYKKRSTTQIGQRPTFLVDGMDRSRLKKRLKQCENRPFYPTHFSIGHRGAPMQFPEHTKESYEAAARQGAGIIECDVTFTSDGELVCRHAECDLHTTTNIITTELNNKCSVPWDKDNPNPDTVRCCSSDITLAEFKTLEGKMDARNANATTAEQYLGGTADWRTDLYTSRGTLLSHKESIHLIRKLGRKFTPELKSGDAQRIASIFGSQENYAQKMIDEYEEMGIPARHVWAQSFNPDDVLYWIENTPEFGKQAVYLDDRYTGSIDPVNGPRGSFGLKEIAEQGVKIIAPPMYFLLTVDDYGKIRPSNYAKDAKKYGLDIIAWTFERSDIRFGSRANPDDETSTTFYYRFDNNPQVQAVEKDSDMYEALDVLARKVGILGIFSDWPATVTYYANCMGIK